MEKYKGKKGSSKVPFITNLIIFLILILTVAGVSFTAYLKSINIDIKSITIEDVINNKGWLNKTPEVSKASIERFGIKENASIGVVGEYIVECTKESVRGFNKKGGEEFSIPLSLNGPMLKTAGNQLLIADINGTELYSISNKQIKWSKDVEYSIINADINQAGYVTVVYNEKLSNGAIKLFDPQGSEIFTSGKGNDYILDSEVLNGNKKLLLNRVNTSGTQTGTMFEFMSMKGDTIKQSELIPGIYPEVWVLDNEAIMAVNMSSARMIGNDGKEKWKQDFADRKIYSSGICQGKLLILAVSKDDKVVFGSSKTDIMAINQEGEQTLVSNITGIVKNIKAYDDIIAVNTGEKVYFLNTKGKVIKEFGESSEILEVFFYNSKEAAIIFKDQVVVVSI